MSDYPSGVTVDQLYKDLKEIREAGYGHLKVMQWSPEHEEPTDFANLEYPCKFGSLEYVDLT